MKNNYLHRIDTIIDEMQTELNSKHEPMTKVINYEYYAGKLHALFELIQDTETLADFVTCYEYRKADRDELTQAYNERYITPLYKVARAAL